MKAIKLYTPICLTGHGSTPTRLNKNTIQDHHIISPQTSNKKRITYLKEYTIIVINDTGRYHTGKMQEGILDKEGGTITWYFQEANTDATLRMMTTKWYRKP